MSALCVSDTANACTLLYAQIWVHLYSASDHKASQRQSQQHHCAVPALGVYYTSFPSYQDLTWPYLPLVCATLNSAGKERRICCTTLWIRRKVEHPWLPCAKWEETWGNPQKQGASPNPGIKLIPNEDHFYLHPSRHLLQKAEFVTHPILPCIQQGFFFNLVIFQCSQ